MAFQKTGEVKPIGEPMTYEQVKTDHGKPNQNGDVFQDDPRLPTNPAKHEDRKGL